MTLRRWTQLGFVLLTVVGVYVVRGHAERWCPFGGVEALYTYVTAGNLTCSLGVSNFYILAGVLLLALLARRAFCGYACPIGAISEWLQAGARRVGVRPVRVPEGLDRGLRPLKYPVLGVILYFTWRVGELVFRGYDPCYVLISRHGEDITIWAYVITAAIVVGSLFVPVPFCRWLCPLAAVFAPLSRFGLLRVRRSAATCLDCGACQRACPMAIPVDRVATVTAARCTSCLECIRACPDAARAVTWGPGRSGRPWPAVMAVVLVLAFLGGAVAATYLAPLPSFRQTVGQTPPRTATLDLRVSGPKCRHSTEQFVQWLATRDDEFALPFVKVEAWPEPGFAAVRITYDAERADERRVRKAITEPRFDRAGGWRVSPYRIQGYDPLEADQDRRRGAETHRKPSCEQRVARGRTGRSSVVRCSRFPLLLCIRVSVVISHSECPRTCSPLNGRYRCLDGGPHWRRTCS